MASDTSLGQWKGADELTSHQFNQLSLENTHNVRIVSAAGSLPSNTPYLTLSHRWGNPPSLILSKETIFLLSEDISPYLINAATTAVFRHAVHVTRSLGFRYLWIDALCMMQDDEAEKMEEIMRMDDVYVNSVLNISATEGSVQDGLNFNRNMLGINPCQLTVEAPKTQQKLCLKVYLNNYFLSAMEGALNQRGWVFQERTLAPRIVHFMKDQVFWECRSLEASEILPRGLPSRCDTDSDTESDTESDAEYDSEYDKNIGITGMVSDMTKIKMRWNQLVDQYSGTSLTFVSDHLLAISAVAKRFCSAMQLHPSDYLAGMWKDDLPLSLLWQESPAYYAQRSRGPSIHRNDERKAPSWSWASVDGRVEIVNPFSFTPCAEVLSVQTQRASPNFFDGVKSCRLRLRGALCKCHRYYRDGSPWIHIGQHTEFQESQQIMGSFFEPGQSKLMVHWDKSRLDAALEDSFFLFHIASDTFPDSPHDDTEHGIILRKTAQCGTYVRVGAFTAGQDSGPGYQGSELEDAFNGRLNTLAPEDYLDLGTDGKYTIEIV